MTKSDNTENAIAERVERILGRAYPDLSADLCHTGGKPYPAVVLNAIEDAESAVEMLGCAVIGSGVIFGGEPADHVIARWTWLAQQKIEVVKALTKEAMESGSHE